MPPPYDVHNFLDLLGIDIDEQDPDRLSGRFTVSHALIAGTGYLWAPVVVALADALCAFGVGRNWPEEAASFTTVESKANFLSSAREGEIVSGLATPLHLARRFSAQSIPTLLVLRGGEVVARQIGAAPEAALREWLERALGTTNQAAGR